ncbi:MAG TPA: TIGR01212 family radical SAM protein, partial [Nitrospiria bacterium]|nr:TIGR01212 family radical SAM protein [Nitrospiria bacterium]
VDAGFTCPNIDGTVAYGGCTFCDNKTFSTNSRMPPQPLSEQIREGMAFYREKFEAEKFIIYFQAFSNTHAPVDRLRSLYDLALEFPDVVGIAIGTRPDCVPETVLDLLSEYHRKTHLWVEYGLQSIHDKTMDPLNRGHSYEQFKDAVSRSQRRGLSVCTHVILGLPGETPEMMMETADEVARVGMKAIKIHHLYIAKNSLLGKQHRENPAPTLSLDAYIGLVCDFLERMPPELVIERLMGELSPDHAIAPSWNKSKGEILHRIHGEFKRRGTRQGSRWAVPVSG